MAKKANKNTIPGELASGVAIDPSERIAIFYSRYTDVVKGAPQVNCNFMKGYQSGEIVWDQVLIDRLMAAKAPIGIYYKEADAD